MHKMILGCNSYNSRKDKFGLFSFKLEHFCTEEIFLMFRSGETFTQKQQQKETLYSQ